MRTKTCPKCGSNDVASIFWGLPAFNPDLEKKIDRKEIVLGGCCVTTYDPKWECNDCWFRWGKRA